jgi:gluconate 2-dehydrogenase gamma chain
MMSTNMIDRREALRRAALLLGGALAAPTVAGVLAGCDGRRPAADAGTWVPRTLSADQNEMVAVISEHIIPETDTPGARAARVNEFVDAMLTDYYAADDRDRVIAGLGRLEARAQRVHGRSFLDCTPEQQVEFLTELDRAAFEPAAETRDPTLPQQRPVTQSGQVATGRSTPEDPGAVAPSGALDLSEIGGQSFFRMLKELTLVGYYTSEVGATQELRVNPMGVYRADLPYAEIGRAWA